MQEHNALRPEQRPHVLVVDDDTRIRELISRYLRESGFLAMSAESAGHARALISDFQFDIIVLDVMMPQETGFEFLKTLRQKSRVPVLMLTALGETEKRIEGFESGADDYLPKPFEPKELVLRLNAILKRAKPAAPAEEGAFRVGRWIYEPEGPVLSDGQQNIRLTLAEDTLLRALAAMNGEVVSREELAASCGVDAGERTIDVQVTRLRRKIEEDTKNPRYLQTVRGKGYLLRVEAL